MSIYVCGDLHGDARAIHNVLAQIENPTGDDFIIVCGDAGFEYEKYVMGQAKTAAKKFPGTWIVMRGNHDSRYWDEHTNIREWNDNLADEFIVDTGWELVNNDFCIRQKKYPNIWYVIDTGGILKIEQYNILFIPGAYSIDKWYRLRNHYPWNPNEQLTEAEWNRLYNLVQDWIDNYNFDIDFVIGHTFPYKLESTFKDLFIKGLNQNKIDKTSEKWLDTLSELYESSHAFKQYFGGHFHEDRVLNDKYTMLYHTVADLADYEEE